jgi:hypothetical protein
MSRNGVAGCASTAFHFPPMPTRGFRAERPDCGGRAADLGQQVRATTLQAILIAGAAFIVSLRGDAMLFTAKCIFASLPPFLVLEGYFYMIGESAPLRLNPTALKIASMLLVLVASNIGQLVVMGRRGVAPLRKVLLVNLVMWISFFVLVGIDSFTVHRGLAKDMERTVPNFLAALGVNVAIFGTPLVLLNLCVAKVTARLWRHSTERRSAGAGRAQPCVWRNDQGSGGSK